mmetsp:Transcript_57075/g.133956  ORF Transcript_57075/g.133956 Transcript_57075/m.133956 type:complete len:174 (-) Transcript_57075:98-619(-)
MGTSWTCCCCCNEESGAVVDKLWVMQERGGKLRIQVDDPSKRNGAELLEVNVEPLPPPVALAEDPKICLNPGSTSSTVASLEGTLHVECETNAGEPRHYTFTYIPLGMDICLTQPVVVKGFTSGAHSQAEHLGVETGMRILKINGQDLTLMRHEDVVKTLQDSLAALSTRSDE